VGFEQSLENWGDLHLERWSPYCKQIILSINWIIDDLINYITRKRRPLQYTHGLKIHQRRTARMHKVELGVSRFAAHKRL